VGLNPASVAAGDLNGDTQVDLAVANQVSESVTLLFGDGNGGFTSGGSLGAGTLPNAVTVADLDGAPGLDLAILASNAVGVFLSQGASGFAPLRRFGAGPETRALVAGDFDEDGRMDVLTANAAPRAPT
jgi:hypothetical protein